MFSATAGRVASTTSRERSDSIATPLHGACSLACATLPPASSRQADHALAACDHAAKRSSDRRGFFRSVHVTASLGRLMDDRPGIRDGPQVAELARIDHRADRQDPAVPDLEGPGAEHLAVAIAEDRARLAVHVARLHDAADLRERRRRRPAAPAGPAWPGSSSSRSPGGHAPRVAAPAAARGRRSRLPRTLAQRSPSWLRNLSRPRRDSRAGCDMANQVRRATMAGAWNDPGVSISEPQLPDPGLYGPDSMTWRIHGDPAMALAGFRSLLLQGVHPLVMAGFDATSLFREDPWGRLRRTGEWIATVTYGTTDEAEQAGRVLRAVH